MRRILILIIITARREVVATSFGGGCPDQVGTVWLEPRRTGFVRRYRAAEVRVWIWSLGIQPSTL
jgi:hypothetical protein